MWSLDAGILIVAIHAAERRPYAHSIATVAGPDRELIDTCQSTRQRRVEKHTRFSK